MSDASTNAERTSVTDRRPVPRGVLPRGMQTWVMTGIAVSMIAIIFIAGRPAAPTRPAPVPTVATAPSPDRVREYQARLRTLERANEQEQASAAARSSIPATSSNDQSPSTTAATADPIVADRKRRDYESLFASNIALSHRPALQRPDAGGSTTSTSLATASPGPRPTPSIDEIADAAVRATARAGAAAPTASSAPSAERRNPLAEPSSGASQPHAPLRTEPISSASATQRLLEGTIIDAVLTNRLDGSAAAPVNCLVTNPIYSHSGQQVVIPAGARVLGETKPVQGFGETRLAVAFHRLIMPDGSTYSLDRSIGLNQLGDAGLHDQVDQHYWSTFGAATAVGLISGLAQFVGTAGLADGDGSRTVIIAGGAAESASQASAQTMNRFLNRPPTVTIREGHRVKIYLTSDLELPAIERQQIVAPAAARIP